MAKVVFTQKPGSIYNDLPEKHYHFPETYLNQVTQALGDWVVYYRPKRGSVVSGKNPPSAYFAIAKLVNIKRDIHSTELYYAEVTDYLEFDGSVRVVSVRQWLETRQAADLFNVCQRTNLIKILEGERITIRLGYTDKFALNYRHAPKPEHR